jgi:putative addiction module component (TIGR02574 family)
MTKLMQDIMKLSVSERISMVEAIWDSVCNHPNEIELSEEASQLLDKRLETHRNYPESGSTWEEVKARLNR